MVTRSLVLLIVGLACSGCMVTYLHDVQVFPPDADGTVCVKARGTHEAKAE